MIKWLELRNFQRFKKFRLELDKYVTVIIGRNDRGKSAIVRAFGWIAFNRPSSKSFLRTGSRRVAAILGIGTNRRVSRTGGTLSRYAINNSKYKAIGRNVPEAIRELLNIADVNIQTQHDALFWFNLTPGQVARELNKLVDLESIDSIQSEIAKRIRAKKAELEVCEKRLSEAKTVVQQLKWVDRLNVKMGKLETRHSVIALKSHQLARIRDAIELAVGYHTRQKAAATAKPIADTTRAIGRQWLAGSRQASKLSTMLASIRHAKRRLSIPIPELPKYPDDPKELVALSQMILRIVKKEKCLCHIQEKIKSKQLKLEKGLKGRCPVCGGILTDQMKLY